MERRTPLTRRAFGRAVGLATLATGMSAAAETAVQPPASSRAAVEGDELCDLTAVDLSDRLQRRDVSAVEVMRAHLARIERIDPRVNAIVTLVAERALADAARVDAMPADAARGPLHGLPIAHKDLVETAGIRTTYGSPFHEHHVPERDAPIVRRMRAAGAITIGKTNTPEFGAGSQTFNRVFGATRNPYDLTKTCGGSSGGAAVALACGMVPLADGSDMGGSLRNPAAFCNVVGFRPSPGRVPNDPTWSPLAVSGPMGRTVADTALLLSVLASAEMTSPLALSDDPARFRGSLSRDMKGARVAWWKDLGGLPIEPAIRDVVSASRRIFAELGCTITDDEPDFRGVDEAFTILRVAGNHPRYAPLVQERPDWVKDTIRFEVSMAERLTAADVGRAQARQTQMFEQTRAFFQRHDYFVLPVTQVAPFDVETPYLERIGDVRMTTYIDWMRSCWYVTLMACPAISVPAGFTPDGLPVGLQIVGRHRDDWGVLQMAHAFEQATHHGARRPPILTA